MYKTIILVIIFLGLAGCSKNSSISSISNKPIIENKEPIAVARGNTVAYAHMKNGTELVNITKTFDKKNKPQDIEVIEINLRGFYPTEYSIPKKRASCGVDYIKYNRAFCESHYTSSKLVKSPLKGALVTVLSAGLALAPGISKEPRVFDEEKFRNVIIQNNLPALRIKLIHRIEEIEAIVKNIQLELKDIYSNEYKNYESNLTNVRLIETTKDKSGFAKNIDIKSKYKIQLDAPKQKEYSYGEFINIEDILHNYDSLKNRLIVQGEKDKLEYSKYVEDSFSNARYLIAGKSKNIYKHNLYVEFNYEVKAPATIPYDFNRKITVPIEITINSANLYNMVPKNFNLKNQDILVQMDKVIKKDLSMNVSIFNYKQEYLSALSLSSYYGKYVFSKNNLNIEIAPSSNTLPIEIDNILSSNILKIANYKNISKKEADKTYITYGYAVKYKAIDTDKEKTLYDQKKYTLSQIAEEYL